MTSSSCPHPSLCAPPPHTQISCCVLTLTLVSPACSGDYWGGLRDAEFLHHEDHDCNSGPASSNCRGLIWQLMLKQHSSSLWGNTAAACEKYNDTCDYYTHIPLPIPTPTHTLTVLQPSQSANHTHTHTNTGIHTFTMTHSSQGTHTNTRIHMLGARYTLTHSLSSTSNGDTQTLIKGSSPSHKHTHTKTQTLL